MQTDTQKRFFPDDRAKQERECASFPYVVRCYGGPKDGEYITSNDPPHLRLSVLARVQSRFDIYFDYSTPQFRPPPETHEYRLQEVIRDGKRYFTYEYQGIQ